MIPENDDIQQAYLFDEELPPTVPKPKRLRGFAAMDPEKRRAICAKGGRAAHVAGTAHQFTTEEAKAAGRKGGMAPHRVRGGRRGKARVAA